MNELKSLVSVGMTVRTLDGKALGRVTTLHGDTFEIEKGVFFNRDYGIAFDEIARVEGREVVLSLSADALAAMRAPGEVGTALADRAALDEAAHAGHRATSKPD